MQKTVWKVDKIISLNKTAPLWILLLCSNFHPHYFIHFHYSKCLVKSDLLAIGLIFFHPFYRLYSSIFFSIIMLMQLMPFDFINSRVFACFLKGERLFTCSKSRFLHLIFESTTLTIHFYP